MGEHIIKNGYKLVISRNRTRITTYENLRIQTTNPIKENKPKKILPSIPSDYKDFNYHNRIKMRRDKIRELAYNSFQAESSVMLSLTFENEQFDLTDAHRKFKRFIQRVNSHYDNFRYLATFNRQSNGRWHYHVLCNFAPTIRNREVWELWNHGITFITYFDKQSLFPQAINYLIDNMVESAGETQGKHGYLCSGNLERNIVLKSYKDSDAEQFDEAFEKVLENKRRILYETKNHLGIIGQNVDTETGELFEYTIPDRELDPVHERAGYKSWDSIFTYVSSAARFDEKFTELEAATPKPKKFKRNKKPKET